MKEKEVQVMVLDDEPIVCNRLKEYLGDKGINVEAFTESEKAIERVKQRDFDVVITDLKMSGPDGIDVLRHVKEKCPSTQVIIITAYPDRETISESDALKAYEYISKPFQLSEIFKLVQKASKYKIGEKK